MPRILFAAVALLFAATAAAQAYRWVDKDGKVHYSQTPPQPTDATKVQKRSVGGSVVETTQLPYAIQQAAKNFPVTIYTAENCMEACKEARALLSQRGVPFREVAVSDESSRAELKKVSGGYPRTAAPLAAKAQKPAAPAAAKAETPQQAAATQAPSGRYAPPAPDAKEAKDQADQAARTAGRYSAPAAATDPKAPAPATSGPYAPK
jgi:glutaredoxin